MPEEIYDILYTHLEDTNTTNNPVSSSERAYVLLESTIIKSSFRLSYRQLNELLSIPREENKGKSKWYTEETDKIHRLCFFSQTLELDYIAGILESPPDLHQ